MCINIPTLNKKSVCIYYYLGGSGGGIWLDSRYMDGIGVVSASGGDATEESGAGSAGRIAVYTTLINDFTADGSFSINGGDAPSDYQAGGGGTVYLQVGSITY